MTLPLLPEPELDRSSTKADNSCFCLSLSRQGRRGRNPPPLPQPSVKLRLRQEGKEGKKERPEVELDRGLKEVGGYLLKKGCS